MVGPCCHCVGSHALCGWGIVHTVYRSPFLLVGGIVGLAITLLGIRGAKVIAFPLGYLLPPSLSRCFQCKSVEPASTVVIVARRRLFAARRRDGISRRQCH